MKQDDLFGSFQPAPPPPRPAAPREPTDPDLLRRKLRRILGEMAPAVEMPWKPWDAEFWIDVFRGMADELPPEEAAEWRGRLDAELARLTASPAAAA